GTLQLGKPQIDVLLRGVDLLMQLSRRNNSKPAELEPAPAEEVRIFLEALGKLVPDHKNQPPSSVGTATSRAQSKARQKTTIGNKAVQPPASLESISSVGGQSPAEAREGDALVSAASGAPEGRVPATGYNEAQERVVRLT